jgi:hypothetical protein
MQNNIRELSMTELDAVVGGDKKPVAPPSNADTRAKQLAAEFAHEIMHALAGFK